MSSEEDVVVVLGSDGIFDVLSDAEAGLYKPKPSWEVSNLHNIWQHSSYMFLHSLMYYSIAYGKLTGHREVAPEFDLHSRWKPERAPEEKEKKKNRRRQSCKTEAACVASACRNNLLTGYQVSTGRSVEYRVRPVTCTGTVDSFASYRYYRFIARAKRKE